MDQQEIPDGSFGIPDRARQAGLRRNVPAAGGSAAPETGARQATQGLHRLVLSKSQRPRPRRIPYTTEIGHPFAAGTPGTTWSAWGLWTAGRPLLHDVELPSGVNWFPEIPGVPVPVAAVGGQRDGRGCVWVLVVGAEERPVGLSRGAGADRLDLVRQVVATLAVAAGVGLAPEQHFRASLSEAVHADLADRLDWSHEWSLDLDEIPSRVVRILGLRGPEDEQLIA